MKKYAIAAALAVVLAAGSTLAASRYVDTPDTAAATSATATTQVSGNISADAMNPSQTTTTTTTTRVGTPVAAAPAAPAAPATTSAASNMTTMSIGPVTMKSGAVYNVNGDEAATVEPAAGASAQVKRQDSESFNQ